MYGYGLRYNKYFNSASGGFNPADLSPDWWIYSNDTDTVTTSTAGSSVSDWDDKGASGYDLVQATPTKQAEYNDEVGITFDDSDDFLQCVTANPFGSDTKGTLFFSFIWNGGDSYIMSSQDTAVFGNVFFLLATSTGTLRLDINDNTTLNRLESSTVMKKGFHYYGYWRSNGSSYELNINGSDDSFSVLNGADDGKWFSHAPNRDNITINALGRSTPIIADGHTLKELFYKNADITAQETTDMLDYLSTNLFTSSNCSYFFDTIDNYIDYGNVLNSVISGASPQFSMRFIVKRITTGAGGYVLFCKRQNLALKKQIYIRFVGDELQLSFSADGTNEWREETTTLYADTNIWYDIIVTFDGTQTGNDITRVYINGIENPMQAVSGTQSGTIYASDSDLLLGRFQGSTNYYSGYHNSFSITSDIITATEARTLFNGGLPRLSSELLDNIEMDCIFDNDTFDGSNFTVIDDSVNANNGASVNMVAIDKDCNENPY